MNPTDKIIDGGLPAAPARRDEPVAPAAPDPVYVAKATRAAVDFESFFISHMLHQMRSTTRELAPEDSVFRDPVNSDMLDMADDLMAGKMAGQRAFGIADAILRQLLPKKA
jgi:flagellar protein FlgJ